MESAELLNYLWLVLAGLVAGFINVAAGGGSLITLPVLIFLGLPTYQANATNRLGIIAQGIFSIAAFRSKGVSAWPYDLYLGITASAGAIIGARISIDIPDDIFNRIIAGIMVMVVLTIIMQKKSVEGINYERMTLPYKIGGHIAFFFIGIYGGFIQAGSGFFIIAALTGINRFSLVKTNSAKMMISLVYTLFAIGVFIFNDAINWTYAIVLSIGTSAGAWFCARWSVDKGDAWIKRILVIMVIALAIKLWFYGR